MPIGGGCLQRSRACSASSFHSPAMSRGAAIGCSVRFDVRAEGAGEGWVNEMSTVSPVAGGASTIRAI